MTSVRDQSTRDTRFSTPLQVTRRKAGMASHDKHEQSRIDLGVAGPIPNPVDVPEQSSTGLDHLVSNAIQNHNDQLMAAANEFDLQLKSMTTWKHQLAAQMELLRK